MIAALFDWVLEVPGGEGFVSSLNLIAPWYGSARNRDRGRLWRDLGIAVRGEVVASLESVFAVDWYTETEERLDPDHYLHIEQQPARADR